ncbi:MAG: thiolase family protein, partial [Thermovirgaceae bacterium]
MGKAVVLSACRTGGGKFGGTLSSFEATDLGGFAIADAMRRSGLSDRDIAEVIMGNGWQAGVGANPARIALYKAGLPQSIPAFTVNKRCGSGLRAVMLASDRVRLGDIRAAVAGGMESASKTPYILPEARWGHRMGDKTAMDVLHKDGFMCPLADMMMGATAEILVDEYDISREEQDAFAFESHKKALAAVEKGLFEEETVPVTVKRKKETITFATEEIPRADTSMEKLGRLPAIFREGGTVTAGTSSALCDAGSAVVVADEEWARSQGYEPMAEILGYASGALAAD